jgi:hypothetical protein
LPQKSNFATEPSLELRYPQLDDAKRQELAWARQALLEES